MARRKLTIEEKVYKAICNFAPVDYTRVRRIAKVLPAFMPAGRLPEVRTNFSLGVRRMLAMVTEEQWEAACQANEAGIEARLKHREGFLKRKAARLEQRRWDKYIAEADDAKARKTAQYEDWLKQNSDALRTPDKEGGW
jgi:hypothetical protein